MAASRSRKGFAVLNLSWTCMKNDLRTHFSKYGTVLSVEIPRDMKTGFNRKVAFVELRGAAGFEDKVLQDYHTIDNMEVTVRPKDKKSKSETRQTTNQTPPESSV